MTDDTAHTAQQILDDALTVAKALGVVCPIVALPASAVKLLVDIGFDVYFRDAAAVARAQSAAQTAGVAAAEAQAATTAIERARASGSMCAPCIETFCRLIDEHKVAA